MLNKTTGRYAFELTDHLGNVRAVVARISDTNPAVEVLSYTDYYPHGGVMPGRNFVSSPSYKLGYQGQEKDAETNFSNFELRQMDARLGRWFNPDPMGQYFSPYLAMGNNPVSMVDPTGGWNGDINYADYMDAGFTTAMEYQNYAQYYDPMMSGEYQQAHFDYKEYESAHFNRAKNEWGHWDTKTEKVKQEQQPQGVKPLPTKYTTTEIWVSNPNEAMQDVNAAYLSGGLKNTVKFEFLYPGSEFAEQVHSPEESKEIDELFRIFEVQIREQVTEFAARIDGDDFLKPGGGFDAIIDMFNKSGDDLFVANDKDGKTRHLTFASMWGHALNYAGTENVAAGSNDLLREYSSRSGNTISDWLKDNAIPIPTTLRENDIIRRFEGFGVYIIDPTQNRTIFLKLNLTEVKPPF